MGDEVRADAEQNKLVISVTSILLCLVGYELRWPEFEAQVKETNA